MARVKRSFSSSGVWDTFRTAVAQASSMQLHVGCKGLPTKQDRNDRDRSSLLLTAIRILTMNLNLPLMLPLPCRHILSPP